MKIKITGKIIFKTMPTHIPNGSLLKVKFCDVSYADASAITLGISEQEIHGYKFGDILFYEIECDRPGHDCGFVTSMGAVLNMGWKAYGGEWIREGDYLNNTRHVIHVKDETQNEFSQDIEVVHYV
uniref:Uncharacterized protein n=1 Tax=Clytia hemisphaerica TaxID=252671 RepID=A0A7M5UQM9_9CNID|eukprot:TCONS_00046708-protein